MKNRSTLSVSIFTVALLLTIGITFAYFTAQLVGGETSDTITVTGGSMNIVYDGGNDINISDIIPGDEPKAIKIFTVTGNNTTAVPMSYKMILIVEYNDFSEESLKYKLISTNTDNNGTVAPNIDLTNLGTGVKTIKLGVGSYDVPTNGNKTHTYKLEIYFLNEPYIQNEDQEKTLKAYIRIEDNTQI